MTVSRECLADVSVELEINFEVNYWLKLQDSNESNPIIIPGRMQDRFATKTTK